MKLCVCVGGGQEWGYTCHSRTDRNPTLRLSPCHLVPRTTFPGYLSLWVPEPLCFVSSFCLKTPHISASCFPSPFGSSIYPCFLCRSVSQNRVSSFLSTETLEEDSEFQPSVSLCKCKMNFPIKDHATCSDSRQQQPQSVLGLNNFFPQ